MFVEPVSLRPSEGGEGVPVDHPAPRRPATSVSVSVGDGQSMFVSPWLRRLVDLIENVRGGILANNRSDNPARDNRRLLDSAAGIAQDMLDHLSGTTGSNLVSRSYSLSTDSDRVTRTLAHSVQRAKSLFQTVNAGTVQEAESVRHRLAELAAALGQDDKRDNWQVDFYA